MSEVSDVDISLWNDVPFYCTCVPTFIEEACINFKPFIPSSFEDTSCLNSIDTP